MHNQIAPHGGELVNRTLTGDKRDFWIKKAEELPNITVDNSILSDIDMIACGALSPIEGFMCRDDYNHVIEHMRLTSGLPWALPIVLGVSRDQADEFDVGAQIALKDEKENLIAILHLQEKYIVNKEREAAYVYKTKNTDHPGVDYLMNKRGDVLLGGDIDVINTPHRSNFNEYRLTPLETRHEFEQLGWSKIVAFQTKRPNYRTHEYIQKCALEICDGLLIHPLVCETEEKNVTADIRMKSYKTLIENYFPENRIVLSVFPSAVKYAGPREAVFHAIVHKNYGCTHFIIGRNHAGVKNYYEEHESQDIFKEFGPHEMEIIPLFFENMVYCKKCAGIVSQKTCSHSTNEHISYKDSQIYEMLQKGESLAEELVRPEVAEILINSVKA
jgi:sulfate adenylyltransferase